MARKSARIHNRSVIKSQKSKIDDTNNPQGFKSSLARTVTAGNGTYDERYVIIENIFLQRGFGNIPETNHLEVTLPFESV